MAGTGGIVARVGDMISIGTGYGDTGRWIVCPSNSVSVLSRP